MISINGKASYIGTLVLQSTTVDNRLLAVKTPTIIPRLSRSIKDFLTWKGTFFFFCMYHRFLIIALQFIFSSDLIIQLQFGYSLSKSTQFCSLNWLIKFLVSYVIKVFYVHVNRQVRSGFPLFPSPPPPPPHTHTHLTSKFSTLIYLNETLF